MGEFLSGLGLMSLQAGCVVLVVLIVRLLFGKLRVPKKYVMFLWLVPYLCMICPWKIESAFGFWRQPQEYQLERVNHILQEVENIVGNPASESRVPNSDMSMDEWQGISGIVVDDGQAIEFPEDLAAGVQIDESMQQVSHTGGVVLGDASSPVAVVGPGGAVNSSVLDSFQGAETVAVVVFGVWLSGVLGIWIYSVISYVQLKRKLICSVKLRDNIYIADDIQMPFVLGLVRPRIYLPGGMNKENQLYVLAHESTHIRRRDTIRKLAALLITAIHWFNPLAWVAWHFMEKDMEMACDEETLQRLGLAQKQAYATALLQLSAGRRFALGAPLAFGEGNVKSRIQNIVKYRKTLGVVSVPAVVLVAILLVVFMSSSSTCALQDVEEEWSVFHAMDDRVSVVMDGERTEFPEAFCTEFSDFFLELQVARNPISKSREEDRVKDIVISFDDERFYYMSEDCTEIWSDNRVKPGYSYRIQNPQEVKDFLERMLGSVTEAVTKGENISSESSEVPQGSTTKGDNAGKDAQGIYEELSADNKEPIATEQPKFKLPEGAIQVSITKPMVSEDIENGVAGVFLDYASEDRIIFHDYYGLFVYDRAKGLTGEIDLKAIGMEMVQGSNAWNVQVTADGSRLYMHGMEDEDMYVYDVELNRLYQCEKYDVSGMDLFHGFLDIQDHVAPDYTVARSGHCVKVGADNYHYLESGSGLPIDFCWVVEQQPKAENATRQSIEIFAIYQESEPVIEPPSAYLPAFTMEDLITLSKEETIGKSFRDYVEKDGFIPENFKRNYQEEALTWNYKCSLAYGGKEYTLQATYWNPLVSQKYGHAPDQLDTVMLYENGSGDGLMLYSIDARNASVPFMDIEDFLAKEYDLGNYISFDLPEGTRLGDYTIRMNDCFEGCLILGDFEEIPHGEWAPKAWYVPGGIGVAGKEVLEERSIFEDGRLAEFHWLGNHMGGEKIEVLENCELPAVLYKYNFDVFTLPELDEYARENNISMDQVESVSAYWYVFFAEPEGKHVYTVFLNQAYFSKEDMVKLAESVRFIES